MVHQYKLNGYDIVLDTCSGSVHLVDDVAYDAIALYKEKPRQEIVSDLLEKYAHRPDVTAADLEQCLDDIAALEAAGKLWCPDVYEEMAFDFKNRNHVVKALCLHVAHTCNLNCSYCFAAQGRYQGERALMSLEVGKRAMEFLIEHSGTRRNLEVDFFGGEPLMNWQMVKDLVAYCRGREKETGKNFRFTLTTNGMLIDDDVIDFCNREMSNVVLSLDGRKEVHDRLRVDYAGRGSYDTIVPKFQKFVQARGDKSYYIRGTYTHANTDFTNDIFHMADLGFTELSMEPVVSKPDDPCALTQEDLPVLLEQYEILAKEMLKRQREGRGFTFYHYMIDLTGGPCSSWATPSTCWATSGRASPTPPPRTSSATATPTPAPSAGTAGPSCTARAAARPTPTTPPAASRASMPTAASCSKSGSSAPSCSRWPRTRTSRPRGWRSRSSSARPVPPAWTAKAARAARGRGK